MHADDPELRVYVIAFHQALNDRAFVEFGALLTRDFGQLNTKYSKKRSLLAKTIP